MAASSNFDLALLLPKAPREVFEGAYTTDSLSATFIYLMVAITLLAAIYVVWKWLRSRAAIAFLSRLLDQTSIDTLRRDRRQLVEDAGKHDLIGDLWAEFDETLVESHDENFLWNTVDASYFFSTHTLARGITESRLISALPGILTAFGVLGTFVGLQLGLSSIDLNAPDVAKSINPLIAGAAVAFSTSVWGVATSVLFNIFEKIIEQRLQRRIWQVQQKVDRLFPRSSPDQNLVEIEHYSSKSSNTLDGLAEQIGAHMQTAIQKLSDEVSSSLNAALTPSIEQLANLSRELAEQNRTGSEDALRGLVTQFSQTLGKAGEEQRKDMQNSTVAVQSALQDLKKAMGVFTDNMDAKLNSWTESETGRETAFKDYLINLESGQRKMIGDINDILTHNLSSADNLMQGSHKIVSQNEVVHKKLETSTESLVSAADLLGQSVTALERLAKHFGEAATIVVREQTAAAETSERAARGNELVVTEFKNLFKEITNTQKEFESAASSLQKSAELAGSTFSGMQTSQAEYLDGLASKIETFGEQVNRMLVNYTEQVQGQTTERLNEWNVQTQGFSQSMVDAISTIKDVVDEIDELMQERR